MASIQETSTSIIKSDRSGRTRYTRAYKQEVVAAYEHSGISAAAFAEHVSAQRMDVGRFWRSEHK